jgi:hypothetical protein
MRRLRSTLTIMEFALRAIWLTFQEPKTTVRWERQGKQLNLSVNVYNHLFDDEIEKSGLGVLQKDPTL